MANVGVIPPSTIVRLDTAVTAPAAGNTFTFSGSAPDGDFSILLQAIGTVTTLSADVQASTDGGTTWSNVTNKTAVITAAAPCASIQGLVSGVLYRLNYTTASGSINVNISSN
jgi:hypothetical protein